MNKVAKYFRGISLPMALVWAGFAAFQLWSMSLVFMFFDDFGYASLSYAYVVPDVAGTDFTIAQLVHFLREIYLGWGGRVLFHGLFVLILRDGGLWAMRIIQSISVFLSFYLLYKLSTESTFGRGEARPATSTRVKLSLFTCALYGAFSFGMFRVGFMWFTASAIFVIPIVFVFAAWYLMDRIRSGAITNKWLMHCVVYAYS